MMPLCGSVAALLWFTDAAIAGWKAEPRTTRGGQRRYSALAIATALTLPAVFSLVLRQTEGLIGSIIGLLCLDLAVPDHTTLSRRAETLELVGTRPGSGPVHLLVDSTGLKLWGSTEWLFEKHGMKTRRDWRKLHIAMDADTRQIAAATLTTNDLDDASQVGALLDQVGGAIASFTAEGAYDQDGVYRYVVASHPEASVILPPRSSAVPSDTVKTAPTKRDRHLQIIAERGRMARQKASGYHWRTLVEADISRLKRVIGGGLRFQTDMRRATKVSIAVAAMNRVLKLGCSRVYPPAVTASRGSRAATAWRILQHNQSLLHDKTSPNSMQRMATGSSAGGSTDDVGNWKLGRTLTFCKR